MAEVLVIYPHDNISTNPTMVGLVRELISRGVSVGLMTPVPQSLEGWDLDSSAATVTSLPLPAPFDSRPTGLRSTLRAWKEARFILSLGRYDAIVGADPLGIAIACRLNAKLRRPMAYISFELMFEREVEGEYEITLKAKERAAAQVSDIILIQDEERRDVFCKENNIDHSRCVLVPVSPADVRPKRTNYLRERLGIGPDKTIVLYQGSLYDWSCRNDFEELVSYWGADECLAIHSRDRPGKRMALFLAVLTAGRSIYFTTEPVSFTELPLLTASADIGLACYHTSPDHWLTGDNLRHLGLASGKIAYYAMCGLPVLSRSLPSIDKLIARYGFGASYTRLSESAEALRRIRANRGAMGSAAREFYERRLAPSSGLSLFCDRLLALRPR